MRHVARVAAAVLLTGAILSAGCAAGTTGGAAKGPATGKPTAYEFSTQS